MLNILSSASKIVFILMALGAIAGFFTGHLEAKDFMLLASMAFSFYFANKGEGSSNANTAGSSGPYLGK